QVLDQDRYAAALGDHDAADLVGRAQQPDAADEILLPALLEVAPADVGVAALQRGEQLLQRHLVVAQLPQVGIDLVLLDEAAEADDVGDSRDKAQLPLDRPVFDRAQVPRV